MRPAVWALAVLLLAAPSRAQTAKPAAAAPDRQALVERARAYLSQKREAEALAELRRAARLGPLERDLALWLAGAESAAGNRLAAERQLRSVADRFQSVQALLQLARLQSEGKDAAAALVSLRAAHTIAPNSEDVLSAYAEAVFASPTPDAAVPLLDALARLYPTVARYHARLGLAFLNAGDGEAAAASLQEAARLEPDQPAILVALGQALDRRALYADAKPHLLRAVSLAPDNLEAVAALAEAEAGLGEIQPAEEHARRVLSRPGSGAEAVANVVLATVLMKQERFAEARDVLLRAAAADPTSVRADYDDPLSRAYAGLHDAASAEKHRALHAQRVKATEARVKRVRRGTSFAMRGKDS